MAAVDAPPGIAFAGAAAGEFVSRPRARRLAQGVFYYVLVVGTLTLALVKRHIFAPGIEVLLVAPLTCFSVAALGYSVRLARLQVDSDGIRWGWRWGGFRMRRDRIKSVRAYRDAFALTPKRGSTWYLSSHDWDHVERVPGALRRAKIPFTRHARRAPWRARLQAYGIIMDLLLVADAVAVTLAMVLAALL